MPRKRLLAPLLLALALGTPHTTRAATELLFWHSMDGALGDQLQQIVDQFNAGQAAYKVVPVFKGSYDETLAAGLAAALAGKGPHILQVYDVGTENMMVAKHIKPLYQLMRDAREPLDPAQFVPAVASFYSDSKGNLFSLPFNTSTPVLYVNKDALQSAGVNPATPLHTWYQMQDALLEVRQKQTAKCGLTTTWPSWVMLENLLAWHNEAFATRSNGYDGLDAQLDFNTLLAIRHISLMTAWLRSKIFSYFGRREEGEARFVQGDCAMLTASSASYANIARNARFQFNVLPLPHYEDVNHAPYNTLMGGASLWATSGKTAAEYKGIAKFFAFLTRPEVQATWDQNTGYLPVTRAAYELTRRSGYYDRNPGTEIGLQELIGHGGVQPYSRGIRIGNHLLIRAVVDEELEQVWSFQKAPKQALDDAVRRGNELLQRFARAHQP